MWASTRICFTPAFTAAWDAAIATVLSTIIRIPINPAAVQCVTCHADQTKAIAGSIHAKASAHPCTSCHGNAHEIFPKDDARSAVYPLNIPKTCGTCHGDQALAQKYGLQNVYSVYMDSIHGYAVSKEGLLVAANCMSCHGSHNILSHKDPRSPTNKANIADDLRIAAMAG